MKTKYNRGSYEPLHNQEEMIMTGSMLDDGLLAVANEFAEEASAEQFVLLCLQHVRQVCYVDYDKPDKDLGDAPTLKAAFGNPEKFSEDELRNAVDHLDDQGQLDVNRYPLRGETPGSHGKTYSAATRVIVSQR